MTDRRLSPKRGDELELFDELIYFRDVFPHPGLLLETPLVEVEEWRRPRPKRQRRFRRSPYVVDDVKLVDVVRSPQYATSQDVAALLPEVEDELFDTAELAEAMGLPRWRPQRIAYACRHVGVFEEAGFRARSRLYRRAA